MFNRLSIKLGLVVALIVVGTTLLARQSPVDKPKSRRSPVVDKADAKVKTVVANNKAMTVDTVERDPNDPLDEAVSPLPMSPVEKARAMKSLVASVSFTKTNATVVGRDIQVTAAVHMFERRPTMRYLWAVRVWNGVGVKKARFVDRLYKDQIFAIPLGEEANPTFADTVRMLPGEYLVEITLYVVPIDFDLTLLQHPAEDHQHRVASRYMNVTVSR